MPISDFLRSFVLDVADIDEADLSFDAPFDEVGLDSLAFVELKVALAKRFGVKIDPERFATGEIGNLRQTAEYVEQLVAERGEPADASART
ncbi:MAG TPA: acyl carrier protein [Caulobacteraceae bacterium]|jgi:acyl carrier protein